MKVQKIQELSQEIHTLKLKNEDLQRQLNIERTRTNGQWTGGPNEVQLRIQSLNDSIQHEKVQNERLYATFEKERLFCSSLTEKLEEISVTISRLREVEVEKEKIKNLEKSQKHELKSRLTKLHQIVDDQQQHQGNAKSPVSVTIVRFFRNDFF